MMRGSKTVAMLLAVVDAARLGKRILLVSTKATARRTHAALQQMGGSRKGDKWYFGAGSIEVRT